MKARFIGEDGSMGFRKGEVYNIETWIESRRLSKTGLLWLRDKDSDLYCPYSTMETLLENWEIIKC